jgi:SAM-dependent methyltransferase
MKNPGQSIIPLMTLKSALKDARCFHDAVNKTFHNIEAKYYDELHQDMWKNLPLLFKLLTGDLVAKIGVHSPGPVKMLDIGCGTGLASDLVLQTALADKITEVTLLDTSPVMLEYALRRSEKWNRKIQVFEGEITGHDQAGFDLILISSVLHHIPDLDRFIHVVGSKLNKGGILLTIHDPLMEAVSGPVYKNRVANCRYSIAQQRKKIVNRVYQAIKRRIKLSNSPDFIGEANAVLLGDGIVHTPLTEVEIWSITDINVEDLPYSQQPGISLNWLIKSLPDFELINYRTYDFFGRMGNDLPLIYQQKEAQLLLTGDKNGRNFGSIWIKK